MDYLNRVAISFREPKSVISSVEIGIPAEVIVHKTSSQPDILIAMSTHGLSGIQRWLIGSVADKVLHTTTGPLLLVRGYTGIKTRADLSLSKVLVPLDGPPIAERALPYVVELAKKMTMEVVLIRAHAAPRAAFVEEESDPAFQEIAKEIMRKQKPTLRRRSMSCRQKG